MLFCKKSNELVYIDFSKKDFKELKTIHYKSNISKISIVMNSLLACNFTFLSKLGKFLSKHNRYYITKVVLYTGFYKGNIIANRIIRDNVTGLRYRIVGGRLDFILDNGSEICIIKEPFCICVNIRKPNITTVSYIEEKEYPNMFYNYRTFSDDVQKRVYEDRLKLVLLKEEPNVGILDKTTFYRNAGKSWIQES